MLSQFLYSGKLWRARQSLQVLSVSPHIQSRSFWSKIKGFNIPVYIPLTTSKGIEHQWSGAVLLYSVLG